MSATAHAQPAATDAATDPAWQADAEHWNPAEAQRWRALLVRETDGAWLLLADHGVDDLLLQLVESRVRAAVRWQTVAATELDRWLDSGDGPESRFRALDLVRDTASVEAGPALAPELSAANVAQAGSPLVRLLDATLFDALQAGASDIHIECRPAGAEIRYRIDGVLQPVHTLDGPRQAEQLVSRLKVMSELDIGERRLPQDGRFKLRVQGREVDFRLSVIPSVFGEDAVVRVLDRAQLERLHGTLTLQALGFTPAMRLAVLNLARAPHGMLLVAGPTGSGKTTTLYAALTETQRPGDKTVSIEDPVEYLLPGAMQIPVNERKGLGFARGLRALLRHDPDRIMVGEIRDAETAEIALQAALTGHVVYSTVHANSAFDVIGRLTHMALDPYTVVSALNGVLAQRLLRVICSTCAMPDEWTPGLRSALGSRSDVHLRRGMGCPDCRGSGFRGRRAVAELMLLDDGLRGLIVARAAPAELKEAARRQGMRALREVALDLVAQGLTTLEEADRVTLDA